MNKHRRGSGLEFPAFWRTLAACARRSKGPRETMQESIPRRESLSVMEPNASKRSIREIMGYADGTAHNSLRGSSFCK